MLFLAYRINHMGSCRQTINEINANVFVESFVNPDLQILTFKAFETFLIEANKLCVHHFVCIHIITCLLTLTLPDIVSTFDKQTSIAWYSVFTSTAGSSFVSQTSINHESSCIISDLVNHTF